MFLQKNPSFSIFCIVLLVGIVGIIILLSNSPSFSDENFVGEAAKVSKSTKTIAKTTTVKTAAITKKELCGDSTCVDGTHVSCYENTKTGDCECEKCPLSIKSWKFQKSLKESQKILKEKKAVKFSLSKINMKKFITTCQTEKRYQTGAPIIDAFMMDFLAGLDETILEDYANYFEMAYCNATNGEIVINITTKKYNWTNTTYPSNFTEYQPFMETEWDETIDYYATDPDYGAEWAERVRSLKYSDFLSEEDMPVFYMSWLYSSEDLSLPEAFNGFAEEIGYNTQEYELLMVLTPITEEDYAAAFYSSGANIIYFHEPVIYLSPTMSDYIYIAEQLRLPVHGEDPYVDMVNKAMHEIGHYTGADHACQVDTSSTCPWYHDLMSTRGPLGYEKYISYLGCSMDFFREYYIPNHPDGSTAGGSMDEYSCE